jgi:hypothetical protein
MDERAQWQPSLEHSTKTRTRRHVLLQVEEASFGHDLTRISPYLYVGGETVTCNMDVLLQHGISHVVDCRLNTFYKCGSTESSLGVKRLWLPIADQHSRSCTMQMKDDLKHSFCHIDEARQSGTACLVHCSSGQSSFTVTSLLLLRHSEWA